VLAAVALDVGPLLDAAQHRRAQPGGAAAMVGVRVGQQHLLDLAALCGRGLDPRREVAATGVDHGDAASVLDQVDVRQPLQSPGRAPAQERDSFRDLLERRRQAPRARRSGRSRRA
jgi:hypothetical protein